MKKIAPLLIFAAGVLWGAMGLFVDKLTSLGFTTLQAAALRICSAAVMNVVFLLIKDRRLLKISIKDFGIFAGLGILSILAMTCFYFLCIKETSSYSVAAILLYTAPVMVSVMSAVLFKERFGSPKIFALIAAFAGCVLVSGLGKGDAGFKLVGIVFGLLSGLAYALYSIFGKFALRKYQPYTVSAYAFVFASAGALVVCDFPGIAAKIPSLDIGEFALSVFLVGLVSAFLPFLLYTLGLKHMDAGKASVIASVEPLAATVCGLIKGQPLSVPAVLGIVCILAAVITVSLCKDR